MLQRVLRPRVLIYTGVLVLIVIAFFTSLALRSPFRVDVVRDRGALARQVDDGHIENVYRLQVMNATEQPQRYRIAVDGLRGVQLASRAEVDVDATATRWVPVSVRIDPQTAKALGPGAHALSFRIERLASAAQGQVRAAESSIVNEKSTFVVPR